MAKELNEDTSFKLSVKTIIGAGFVIATVIGMWFALQADIAEAKELPKNEWNPEWIEKLPPDEVSRMEFQMKDEMIRNTIMTTQEDVTEIKETLEKIEDKLYNR
tara:strand:+ start:105 stop:416 length:312 start_codon:yes stop_codon:yes gene_type:complete